MDNITQGLFIFGVGMVVLTVALGLLALMIELLGKVFREKAPQIAELAPGEGEEPPPPAASTKGEVVAAAVAVSYLLSRGAGSPSLGRLLQNPPGPYRLLKM